MWSYGRGHGRGHGHVHVMTTYRMRWTPRRIPVRLCVRTYRVVGPASTLSVVLKRPERVRCSSCRDW